jgi:hypothetical protein
MLRDGEIVADHKVPDPYEAGTVERPSENAELEMVIKDTYYANEKVAK